MRFKFVFEPIGKFLPFNYNVWVHAMIFDKIRTVDEIYAQSLHDSKDFKYFTFSQLEIPKRRLTKEGLIITGNEVILHVSSPSEKFMEALVSGFTTDCFAKVGPLELKLSEVTVEDNPDFSKGLLFTKTLSPVVSTTKEEINGKLKIKDLLPSELKFYDNLKDNLISKFRSFYGREPADSSIDVKCLLPVRTTKTRIKDNIFYTGNLLRGTLSGSKELLQFAYDCGLGEKNSMGFGMIGGS